MAIKDGENWFYKEKKIEDGFYFTAKFTNLFNFSFSNVPTFLENLGTRYISEADKRELNRIPTKEGIKECIW